MNAAGAYTAGVEAFAAWLQSTPPDMELLRNPHRLDSVEHDAWRNGWHAAQRQWETIEQERAAERRRDRNQP